ncbi:MAG: ATP-binding protein [Chloroflexi bacterium]|nr:ATP-binding protein [Chloroflexota bacterium]
MLNRTNDPTGPSSPQDTPFVPLIPTSQAETGLNIGFVADLALKFLYFEGYLTGLQVAEMLRLPFSHVVDDVLQFLKRERFVEVKGSNSVREATYQYAITSKGSERAQEVLERSRYVGPAPAPIDAYTPSILAQTVRRNFVSPETIRQELSNLILTDRLINQIGPAVNSGRSIFLFGSPGNGKTAIAEAIGRMLLRGRIFIPNALEIDGQVVQLFDPVNHRPVSREETAAEFPNYDPRWIWIQRPAVMAGGELTLDRLDLIFSESNLYYEAPLQMKANGGMLLIDDFGRQQARPEDLLNRWIVPLEKRVDYLTLRTGRKIEVPFDVLIVFSTNLEPAELVDEAFLRRIRHKIEVKDPTFEQYRQIFRRECKAKGVPYQDEALVYLLQEHYIKPKRPLRGCHPRDLLEELVNIARFAGQEPALTKEMIDLTWDSYYVDLNLEAS